MATVKRERIPWADRLDAQVARYPSIGDDRWEDAFRDYELMGGVLRDLLRVATQTRRGQRPKLGDVDVEEERLRKLVGDDYSTAPFGEAFQALAGDRSRRHVASRTGIGLTQVHRYLTGEAVPSVADIEKIAAAFGKAPTFFAEYRTELLLGVLREYLSRNPEATIGIVHRLEAAL